ncbi:GH25 family lysozyme [Streptomyces sp.]|uniref:GH25 family lysozyme n=1 Tax=Streptomyces sp. TaxID=1931 RepID=UPI0028128C47|nr:GH25 family lysozyme [Streptomyces sp.]
MKATPRLTLPAALTAAVLAITTLTPTAAAEEAAPTTLSAEHQGNLVSKVVQSDGEIVSTLVDAASGESILPDPALAGTRPDAGSASGGAVLGQWAKSETHFEQLAASSARTAAELDGGSGAEEPVGGAASADALGGAAAAWAPAGIKGTDVSNWQTNLNWSSLWNQGSRFAYVKATEGSYYKSPSFNAQYVGAGAVGMYRGAYHFANPETSSGAAQADYFIANGGGWTADGKTLPGLVDLEDNPYGDVCYNKTPAQMVSWIRAFSDRYKARTGRLPAIYTGAYWWNDCTGNSTAFNDHPMHIASYGVTSPIVYPAGWTTYDIWQYTDKGFKEGIDANVYRGSAAQLQDLVRNRYYKPIGGRAPSGSSPQVQPAGYSVKGGIGIQYRALGGSSVFGTPSMNERGGLVNGGVYQRFSKGSTFYWSSATQAWPVNFNGAIGQKFVAHRHENGFGYPSTREIGGLTGGGAYQVFRNGNDVHIVLWSPGVGAHAVKENSAIGREWQAAGSEHGYGYPATGEYRYGTEVRQKFSKGFTVHYSTTTKRTWVTR